MKITPTIAQPRLLHHGHKHQRRRRPEDDGKKMSESLDEPQPQGLAGCGRHFVGSIFDQPLRRHLGSQAARPALEAVVGVIDREVVNLHARVLAEFTDSTSGLNSKRVFQAHLGQKLSRTHRTSQHCFHGFITAAMKLQHQGAVVVIAT
jgi:hypothetical protein